VGERSGELRPETQRFWGGGGVFLPYKILVLKIKSRNNQTIKTRQKVQKVCVHAATHPIRVF